MILRTLFFLLVLENLFRATSQSSASRNASSNRTESHSSHSHHVTSSKADDDELRLITDLFANYNKNVRPAKDKSQPIQVKFGIAYTQIVDLNEKDQTLVSNIWVRMQWYNNLLRWNSSHYGGIKSINLSPIGIWLPDIVLHNNAGETLPSGTLYQFKTRVILDSDGKNTWYAPTILSSGCSIDITYFPFDDQLCELKFGSWTYNGFQVNVVEMSNEADLASYMKSSEFILVSAKAKRNVVFYSCCPEPYPDITFYLHLRRKPGFFLFNVIIPCLVITALAVLTFLLPPEIGERVTLIIESFLAMSFVVLMVSDNVPQTSDSTPLIVKFLLIAMVEVGLTLLANCISLRLYQKRELSHWMRVVFLHYLARMTCMKTHSPTTSLPSPEKEKREIELEAMKLVGATHLNNIKRHNEKDKEYDKEEHLTDQEKFLQHVSELVEHELRLEDTEITREFWIFTSQVCDRLFLIIFTLCFVISSSMIFMKVPAHYNIF